MKKFLQKCTLAFFIIVAVNLLSFAILFLFSPGFKKIHESSGFKNKNFDMLVFGNSMALDGIDMKYLEQEGINCYDFAVAGAHISSAVTQLEEYLRNNQKPKTVLIGFSSATGRSLLNKVPYANPEMEFFYHPSFKDHVLNPAPVNFRWLFVEMLKIFVSKDHRNSIVYKGQWVSPKTIPDTSVYKARKTTLVDYKNPYLLQIVNLCESKGIKVILVELPGAAANRDDLPFKYDVDISDSKKATMYNLNNYEVSSKLLDPSKDWLAPDHLNKYGAKKVTTFLFGQILKKE